MVLIDIDDFYVNITKLDVCVLIGRYNGIDVYFNFDIYHNYMKEHFRVKLAVDGLNFLLNETKVNFYDGKKYEIEFGKDNIIMICSNCEVLFTNKKCNLNFY